MRRKPGAASRKALNWIRAVSGAVIVVFSAMLEAPPSEHPLLAPVSWFARTWGWLVILLASLIGLWVCSGLIAWNNRAGDPKLRAVLDTTLRQFRDYLFEHAAGNYSDHRVTLFERKGFAWSGWRNVLSRKWPWSGWLVPVARPGYAVPKTKTRFWAPEDASEARGVVGRAWAANDGVAVVTGLPDIGNNPDLSGRYAEQANVGEEWVIRHRPRSRSLAAFAVEQPDGKRWGVLVLDSVDPRMELEDSIAEYRSCYARILSRIVEEL